MCLAPLPKGYIAMSTVVYFIMNMLGEMTTYLPVRGSQVEICHWLALSAAGEAVSSHRNIPKATNRLITFFSHIMPLVPWPLE
ncbi:uncharacterized protein N7473_002849 [Penicillium subrubescens]|uniref:uncharacterized protein n=1 Tax=Penicillium subrubescens TaxID=1316194 RepID=UPI0025459355|nr:uncharacterized protein N7473_002849 [Penicillium subrubescens]KAJ5905933.1 hypothetical protein N7473_002849 [Penicillium subrubescens]